MPHEITEERLQAWLEETLRVAHQSLDTLPHDIAAMAAAGITAGGEIEMRIRLRPSMQPRIVLALIGDRDELELRNSDTALLGAGQ